MSEPLENCDISDLDKAVVETMKRMYIEPTHPFARFEIGEDMYGSNCTVRGPAWRVEDRESGEELILAVGNYTENFWDSIHGFPHPSPAVVLTERKDGKSNGIALAYQNDFKAWVQYRKDGSISDFFEDITDDIKEALQEQPSAIKLTTTHEYGTLTQGTIQTHDLPDDMMRQYAALATALFIGRAHESLPGKDLAVAVDFRK